MRRRPPQVVAMGGGGFSMEAGNSLLDDYILSITGVDRPKVCFLGTASGDADHYIVRFYRAFPASRCEPSHISLFRRERGGPADPRAHLLEQDVIYVGGGSGISLMGAWKAHGLDTVLRECHEAGVVLAGLSAGSLCWFSDGVTAFHGPALRLEGIGAIPCSNAPHYDTEPARRAEFHAAIEGGMVGGWGVEESAAVHFVDGNATQIVASKPAKRAFEVSMVDGKVVEVAHEARYLGDVQPVAALAA